MRAALRLLAGVGLLLAGSSSVQADDVTFYSQVDFEPLSNETVYRLGTDAVTGRVTFTPCQSLGGGVTSLDVAVEVVAIRKGTEVSSIEVARDVLRSGSIDACTTCFIGRCPEAVLPARIDGPHSIETFEDWVIPFIRPDTDLFLRVVLDPDDRISETDETNNAVLGGTGFDLIPLNGELLFGSLTTSLGAVTAVTGGACAADEVELTSGTTTWDPSEGGQWDLADVPVAGICALPQLASGGYELLASNSAMSGPISGTAAGQDVTLADVLLDGTGAHPIGPLTVDLPTGHSAHVPDPNDPADRPVARGTRTLDLPNVGPGTTQDLATLTASGTTDLWLRARALPLQFRMLNFSLSGSILDGVIGEVRWVYDQAWGVNDPRNLARRGPITNDVRFSRPSASQLNNILTIAPTGIAAVVSFDSGNGETHFPRTRHQFDASQITIVDGALQDGGVVGLTESYAFRQSADCGGCDAGTSSVADRNFTLTPFDFQGLGDDGAVLAPIFSIGTDAAWGPRVFDGSANRNRFQRVFDSTQPGVFYLPGYAARQTGGIDETPVHDYLLGMRQGTTGLVGLAPGVVHPLPSVESRRGNEFAAGLTVGPQTYRDVSGQPIAGFGTNLAGSGTELALGAPGGVDVESAISSPGTKYVVRPGGVTGVFNSDPGDAPDPTVYGYVFDLRRFAFRTLSNQVDEFTWIDGRVSVPAPGEFGIEFASLDLGCDGSLGAGAVEREPCNGIDDNGNGLVDENCNETLRAWRTDFDVVSMNFEATDPDEAACEAGDRALRVGSTVDLFALDETLGLSARWSAAGEPVSPTFTGRTSQVLDRPISPATPDDDLGFPVALEGDMSMLSISDDIGWFESTASLALPFWSAIDVRARLENASPTQQDQSIIVRSGYPLPSADNATAAAAMRNDSASYASAQYTWGSTGYGIGPNVLPLYYDANRFASKRPRFLGEDNELFDVVVARMRAGVNFADPERTKVSFGASADFTKLAALDIDLNVDLSSDESVSEMDDFLNSLGIPGMPTQDLVGEIRSKTNLVNDVVDAGLDGFIEQAVEAAVDPFDFEPLSDALGIVQSIPEQMASVVSDELEGAVDALVDPLTAPLDQAALDLYQDLPSLLFDAGAGSPDVPALETAIDQLGDAERALGAVETALDEADDELGAAESTFDAAFDDTTTWVADAQSAIGDLETFLATGSQLTACGSGNPLRSQVGEVQMRVDDFVDALDSVNLEAFAGLLNAVVGVDLSAITSAQRDIRDLAEDLSVRIANAQGDLNGVLGGCSGAVPYADVLDDATSLLADLNTQIGQITGAMAALRSELQTGLDLFGVLRDAIADARFQVGQVRKLVQDLRVTAESAQASDILDFSIYVDANAIRAELDTRMLDLTDGAFRWYYAPSATPEHSFVVELATFLREPIDQAIADVAAAVQSQLGPLATLVPHPSPEELEDLVVDLVMNSPVVEDLDRITQEALSEIVGDLNVGSLLVLDQMNAALKDLFERVEGAASEAILAATAPIQDVPMAAGKLDGYAVIAGNELERLHIGAEFSLQGDDEGSSSRFEAALDVTSWNANGKAEGCLVSADGLLDAVISTRNLPIEVGAADVLIKELYLGFTLDQLAPVGVFGGISTEGAISFEAFEIYDVAFHSGVGALEVYLGARAGAVFESVQLDVAFLVGKTCNLDVVRSLDPQIAEFIELPSPPRFNGAFVRGSASIPIFTSGCFLTVGVGADAGAWLLVENPVTIGGVVGGAAYGQALCIASLRGQVTVFGQKSGDEFSFQGDGFGVAGIGFDCDPATWTSVPRSRGDDWCGTGDAQFGVQFQDGWQVDPPSTSAIH